MPRIATAPAQFAAEIVGITDTVRVPTPAAGAEWSYTVPAGYYAHLVTGYAVFTTSGTASNRLVGLQLTDGNDIVGFTKSNAAVVAIRTTPLSFQSAVTWSNTGTVPQWLGFGLPYMWMPPGFVLGSSTDNLQAGDTYTNIRLFVEYWDYGAYGRPERMHNATLLELEEIVTIDGVPHARLAKPEHRGGGK